MAKRSSRGPTIIAGAIVVVGLLIVITLIALSKGDSNSAQPSTTPAGSTQTSPTPRHTRSPRVKPSNDPFSPSPSPTPTKSPKPSPTPTTDPIPAIKLTTSRAANQDRHGEVQHIGDVNLYHTDKATCESRSAASVNVRYDSDPKLGIFYLCLQGSRWIVTSGPLYGE